MLRTHVIIVEALYKINYYYRRRKWRRRGGGVGGGGGHYFSTSLITQNQSLLKTEADPTTYL